MKTRIELKHGYDCVVFSHECEDNTIKKTVEEAIKQGVSLKGIFLCGADLEDTDFSGVDLSYVKFDGANLRNTNFSGANLCSANLSRVDLFNANMENANLSCTKIISSICNCANFSGANFYDAYIANTIFEYAKIENAENFPTIPTNLPEGEFIAWKKVFKRSLIDGIIRFYIIKLKILADSKRSRAMGDKCRCDKALVLEIQSLEGKKLDLTEITNNAFAPCTYKVGEIVYADEWNENRFLECTHGIHFFLDRTSAAHY